MSTLRSLLIDALDLLSLGDAARKTNSAVRRSVQNIKASVKARVLWLWKPLVPEDRFTECCQAAIQALRSLGPDDPFGDYLEFGVSRGTSLACMYRALEREGLSHVRLLGFDSFRGLPPEAVAQGWSPGDFWSTAATTRKYLLKKHVKLDRVALIEGWFKDTLTRETIGRFNIAAASLIMIDCDLYSASREALWFSEPLIHNRAVIFFDDWGWRSEMGEIGQKEAFAEFLAAFPALTAEPLPAYIPQARVFLVTRLAPAMC